MTIDGDESFELEWSMDLCSLSTFHSSEEPGVDTSVFIVLVSRFVLNFLGF